MQIDPPPCLLSAFGLGAALAPTFRPSGVLSPLRLSIHPTISSRLPCIVSYTLFAGPTNICRTNQPPPIQLAHPLLQLLAATTR
eukprot:m.11827 g.11827  ORF g.11827 m.11827 type:complete len:84 (+) comp7530_c0_seq1:110-361(+)